MSTTGDRMGIFERFLTLWVAAAMATGIALGALLPDVFVAVADLEVAGVNLVVAILIWVMVYPMMLNVDLASLRLAGDRPRGLFVTVVVNWLVKPFSMAALGLLFFEVVFRPWVAPVDARQYVAGMILLGAAPCTAMVFVWSQLTRGDATYTLVQVSVNTLIMVFAYAPLVALLLDVADVTVPWSTLVLAVLLYVVAPLVGGHLTRRALLAQGGGAGRIAAFSTTFTPYTIASLLATVVLLFALQGHRILDQPLLIGLIAVPLLVQSYGIFLLAYGWAWAWRLPFAVAAPAALIGTSNFFEVAVAVAISLFGFESGAALATVVGVLVEVPVMLSLVVLSNRTEDRFPRERAGARRVTSEPIARGELRP